jgi:2-polyprenyl-3-methyl-5-hydroxy-6-metoxy-1,4-benzoquinol methylase
VGISIPHQLMLIRPQNSHPNCPVCKFVGRKKLRRKSGEYQFLSCPICSFQFMDPYLEGRQTFDDYSWTKEFTEEYDRYIKPVSESLEKKIGDVISITGRRPKSFLDVGCGNGLYLNAADILGLRNLGTDVDRVNIEFAKSKKLNAVASEIEDLDIAERFDFVHLKAVMHLVPDPPRLLAKANGLLSPGGVMYVDVPNQGSLFSKLRILRHRTSYGQLQLPMRRGAYNFRALSFLCNSVGLKIVKRVYPYPGDKVYYPLETASSYKSVFRLFAKVHISSLIGVYLINADAGIRPPGI